MTSEPSELASSILPAGSEPILLYGGTFDPPHRGHVRVPNEARAWLDAETNGHTWLVYVPAAISPHKGEVASATGRQRVEMLERATANLERIAIWNDETRRRVAEGRTASQCISKRNARAVDNRVVRAAELGGAWFPRSQGAGVRSSRGAESIKFPLGFFLC